MKQFQLIAVSVALTASIIVVGCSKPAPVDAPTDKVKQNFSPRHKAMMDKRKEADGP